MSLYTTDDTVLCRVFPTSLKGGALSWFTKLPTNSIDCFETLMAKFDVQFAMSRPHHLTSIALVDIRQEKGESMRTFINRFGKTAISIRNLSPEVTMHHMLTALRPGPSPIACACNPQIVSMISDAERPSSCSCASSEISLAPRQVGKRRSTESDRESPGLAKTQNGTTKDLVSLDTHPLTSTGEKYYKKPSTLN